MLSLKLENCQGYPRLIIVQASSNSENSSGIGVTVQDVLRAIHEDLRTLLPRPELTRLEAYERAEVAVAFKERCSTEEELGQGPCRIDLLGGRDRLQIFPKIVPEDAIIPAPIIPEDVLKEPP